MHPLEIKLLDVIRRIDDTTFNTIYNVPTWNENTNDIFSHVSAKYEYVQTIVQWKSGSFISLKSSRVDGLSKQLEMKSCAFLG